MGAKKSQDLPSASKRIRKARGIIQPEFEGLRTRGVDGVTPSPEAKGLRGGEERGNLHKSSSLKAQEPGAPLSKGRGRWMPQLKKKKNLPFLQFFVLFRSSKA